jgi:hypothetical protein
MTTRVLFGPKKTNIKYNTPLDAPRSKEQTSFRHLHFDETGHATVSSVLGISETFKVGTMETLNMLARVHTGSIYDNVPAYQMV